MTKTAARLIAIAGILSLGLAGCAKAPNTTNVADTENSAGAALENSAAELEATTDNLVDGDVANINAAANATALDTTMGNNVAENTTAK